MPEHVQQAFLVARAGGVVVAASHVGKHAGHGYGGFGAAGMHIGEGNDALLAIEQRSGVARVAEDAEVIRPRAFAYHQHGQRLAPVGLPGRRPAGVGADLAQRFMGRRQLLAQIAIGGVQVVAGHHQQAQLVVVAQQGGHALVVDQRHGAEHGKGTDG
ncbi:hypothetical protein D3C76_1017640 [compost metagenome]